MIDVGSADGWSLAFAARGPLSSRLAGIGAARGAVSGVIELADSYGAEIRLAGVKPSVLDVLRRDEVVDALGEDHILPHVYEAAADRMTR